MKNTNLVSMVKDPTLKKKYLTMLYNKHELCQLMNINMISESKEP